MSSNYDIKYLSGIVKKEEDSFLLERTVDKILVRYILIDSQSRNPSASKRFLSFIGMEVDVEGILQKRILYVRKMKLKRLK